MYIDLKIALSYLGRFKMLLISTILVIIVSSVLEGIGIGMIIPILEVVEGGGEITGFTRLTKSIFSIVGIEYNFLNLMLIFGIFMCCKFGLMGLQSYITRVLSSNVQYELRKLSFDSLIKVPLHYYYKRRVGDIIATVFTSVNHAGGTLELAIIFLVTGIFTIVYVTMSLLISVKLTVVAFALIVVSSILIIPRFKVGFIHGRDEKAATDRISSFLIDKLGGVRIVKVFRNEVLHKNEFKIINKNFRKMAIKIQSNRILVDLLMEPFVTIIAIALLCYAKLVLNMPVVLLVTFFYILMRIIPKIKAMHSTWLMILNYLPHFSKVQEIIDPPGVSYPPKGIIKSINFRSNITFKGVFFRYYEEDEFVLKRINFSIEKNRITALVGESGGGKSTIADLIVKHQDPSRGTILVDNINLHQVDRDHWLGMISVVDQDPYLFHDTIYNNILYGKIDATYDNVMHAAQLANADGFIHSLPEKYKTIVGERGVRLSGGQKQRICLARALLKDPEILILDEATSSLDNESERVIQEAIEKLSNIKTIVIIAHRLSTIANADKIIVLENGKIVEQGTHEGLIQSDGQYSQYYHAQFNEK